MKRLLPFFFGIALLLPFCSMHAGAQSNSQGSPPAINFSGTLSALNGVVTFNPLPGYSTCVVDVTTTASNVVTVYGEVTSTHPTALTSTSGSATITADGAYVYQVPFSTLVVKATTFGGAAMSVVGWCSQSVATAVSSGGSSSNATIVAPTDAAGNVKVDVQATANVQAFQGTSPWVVSAVQPSPLYTSPVSCATPTCAVVNFPGTTVTPTATPSAAPASQPVVSFEEANCGTGILFCPLTSSGTNTNGGARNALNINICNAIVSVCTAPAASPNATAQSAAQNVMLVAPCANNAGTFNCQAVNASQQALVVLPAPPSPAPAGVVPGGFNSGGLAAPVYCNKSVRLAGTTVNTLTQVLALSGTTINYICGWSAGQIGTVLLDIQLSVGTGTNCGSTNVVLDEAVASSATNMQFTSAYGYPLVQSTAASQEICVDFLGTTSTTNSITVYYTQF